MNWEAVAAICAAGGVVNYLMLLSVKQAIAENNERLREWINGSFMRSKEVEAKLAALEVRIDGLEGKR